MRRNVFMPVFFIFNFEERTTFKDLWLLHYLDYVCILWMLYTHKQKFIFRFGWFCVILYFRLLKVIENIRWGIFIQILRNDKIHFFSSINGEWPNKTKQAFIYVYFCMSTSVYISMNIWIETWYSLGFSYTNKSSISSYVWMVKEIVETIFRCLLKFCGTLTEVFFPVNRRKFLGQIISS